MLNHAGHKKPATVNEKCQGTAVEHYGYIERHPVKKYERIIRKSYSI